MDFRNDYTLDMVVFGLFPLKIKHTFLVANIFTNNALEYVWIFKMLFRMCSVQMQLAYTWIQTLLVTIKQILILWIYIIIIILVIIRLTHFVFLRFGHGPILVQINLQHSQAQPYCVCTRVIYLTQTHYEYVCVISNILFW